MLDVRATVGAVAAPRRPTRQPAKTPEKTPQDAAGRRRGAEDAGQDGRVDAGGGAEGQGAGAAARQAEGGRRQERGGAPASEPKKAKQADLTLPDEEKPKKVAAADKPAAEPKPPADKPPDKSSAPASSGGGGEGWLRLGSKPWTNIIVDGKETGLHTPQTHLKLGAGSHRITLTNPQFNIKETFSVEIKSGETETVIKDLRPQGGDSD